jgi:transposase-like protein
VALEHGLNDNLVRRWIKAAADGPAPVQPDFVPLALPAPSAVTQATVADDAIVIEVPRAVGTVTIRWPASQADRATAFLRELLL